MEEVNMKKLNFEKALEWMTKHPGWPVWNNEGTWLFQMLFDGVRFKISKNQRPFRVVKCWPALFEQKPSFRTGSVKYNYYTGGKSECP